MEETFTIPERPWGEAEVSYLAANAHLLDEETRAELGFVPAPVEDFKADVSAPVNAGPAPVVDTGVVDPVGVVTVDGETITPEDVAAGVAAFNALSVEVQEAARAEAQAATGLPTDTEGAVVDNQATDNA